MRRLTRFALLMLLLGSPLGNRAEARLPLGATGIDQSAYALGTVRLNVIFAESNGGLDANQENWTAAQLDELRSEIFEATSFWESQTAAFHPNAQLRFDVDFVNGGVPLPTQYEPITRSSSQDNLWIDDLLKPLGYASNNHFTNVRNFNNDRRRAAGTNWVATLLVVNDLVDTDNRFSNSQFAYGYIGGPYLMTTYANNGWRIDRFNQVLSHELAHTFFALDEYVGGIHTNVDTSGYLNVVNGNSERAVSGIKLTVAQPNALMLNNTLAPSSFTLGQVGIRDSDGDSVPDVLDTFPLLTGDTDGSDAATGTFLFRGSAEEVPLANLNTREWGNTNSQNEMSINWIAAAQYNLDQQGWRPFSAADGALDEYVEPLELELPGLAGGGHTIWIRSLNSVDNSSNVLAFNFNSTNPVPEPATWALLLSGALGWLGIARRRTKSIGWGWN